jgi:protein SCO1/2
VKQSQPRASRLVWVGAALFGALLVLIMVLPTLRHRASHGQALPDYGAVADFSLTNQDGAQISLAALKDRVWIADIIFTRCPGPCLKMTRQMSELHKALSQDSEVKLVTLTTDPDFDTPTVLKAYGRRFGADFNQWMFLTGAKTQVAALATGSLKLTALGKKPEERQSADDLFVHSTIFVVVDKRSHLRGVFETTGETVDPVQVRSQILETVRQLENES